MKKVTYISRHAAEHMPPPKGAVIISLHDKSESPASLKDGWADRLTLRFHDTDGETLGLEVFDESHAQAVLAFVRKNERAPELVVHCQMGVSRSAAIAMMLSEVLGVQCYMGQLPVSFATYKNYNKRVYRTLLDTFMYG